MRRLQNHSYQQRSLLIFLPLVLLIIASWTLSARISPSVPEELRVYALLICRTFALSLCAITIAMIVPVHNRTLQLIITALSYVMLTVMLAKIDPVNIISPVLCVLCSTASTLALLPRSRHSRFIPRNIKRTIFEIALALCLPFISMFFAFGLLSQIGAFVEFTFSQSIGKSLYSSIYAPIYLVLQTFGFQYTIADIASSNYHSSIIDAFTNAVVLTTMLSLPSIIIAKSFFTEKTTRLFLTFLACTCVLGGSIGSVVSLILLLVLVLWPGTYFVLLSSSVVLFYISYYLGCDAIIQSVALYNPDLNLGSLDFVFSQDLRVLNALSIIIPIFALTIGIFLKRDKEFKRRQLEGNTIAGYKITPNSPIDLQIVCILRSVGGISNISHIENQGSLLYIYVKSTKLVQSANLHLLSSKKIIFDRHRQFYSIDLSIRCKTIEMKLKQLCSDVVSSSSFNLLTNSVTMTRGHEL